ncbi:cation diffusion facilitator family transporter [Butyrivibrio sp. VCB2006]|uniref:cation diffusion facilitator family transporter n=1 Tax=Butyrivibrio sp. VCB2006 TaxID=1280679 RepID=UPI0003F9DD59|nr:cation diffusion facilitator family transporter [Butyrivibrio sp. VCB2006]
MICFLARFFVKDFEQVKLPKVRQGYGLLSGLTGIGFNIFLFLTKFMAGVISGSISIFGDAFNNLSDAASSIVTFIGFKLAGEEADEQHPFGHGRLEYIAGLIVSLFIILTGCEVVRTSVNKILKPQQVEFNATIAVILIVSILIKLLMFQGNLQAARKIDSKTLKSVAMDSISDVFTTSVVLASSIFAHKTGLIVDGFFGVFVGFFIIKTGYEAAKDTINPLLGEPPSKEFVDEVKSTVMNHEGILGVHDLMVHNYGPSRIIMSLHVEVPSDQNIVSVHDLIDDIETELRQKYHCSAVIHMDPVIMGDKETETYKSKTRKLLEDLSPELTFHDFRLIHHKNGEKRISFDVQVPYKYNLKDEKIIDYLTEHLQEGEENITLDIDIDKMTKDE